MCAAARGHTDAAAALMFAGADVCAANHYGYAARGNVKLPAGTGAHGAGTRQVTGWHGAGTRQVTLRSATARRSSMLRQCARCGAGYPSRAPAKLVGALAEPAAAAAALVGVCGRPSRTVGPLGFVEVHTATLHAPGASPVYCAGSPRKGGAAREGGGVHAGFPAAREQPGCAVHGPALAPRGAGAAGTQVRSGQVCC